MPEFQRLVIWLHLDKKNNNNNGKEKNKQSVQEYKTKRERKKICPIPEQSHIQNI